MRYYFVTGEVGAFSYLVGGVVTAGFLHLHQDEGMEEVGGDHVGDKRCGLFLKHHGNNVVSYVAFPLQLRAWLCYDQL